MHSSWINLMNEVDVIHVFADWTKNMLLHQGINSKKIKLIRTAGPKKYLQKREF